MKVWVEGFSRNKRVRVRVQAEITYGFIREESSLGNDSRRLFNYTADEGYWRERLVLSVLREAYIVLHQFIN